MNVNPTLKSVCMVCVMIRDDATVAKGSRILSPILLFCVPSHEVTFLGSRVLGGFAIYF